MNPVEGNERFRNSLRHLAELDGQPPTTNMGKVVWAWPQISAAFERGWRLSDVWSALRKDGIEMSYRSFGVYVHRIRRRLARNAPVEVTSVLRQPAPSAPSAAPTERATPVSRSPVTDPYASAREQRRLKRESGFEYDPFSVNKHLLE
jgi:hypothetical protein